MEYAWTDGTNSTSIAIRIPAGVLVGDITNPSAPVYTALNFCGAGLYTNGQPLTGLDSGNNPTLPSLTLTITSPNGDTTIWQGGEAKNAYPLPFVIYSVANTVPLFIFNAPRVAGIYHCIVTFTYPNGGSTIIKTFDLTVLYR